MKIVEKIKKCSVWKWNLYSLKLEWKKWEYVVVSKNDKFWQINGTVSIVKDKSNNFALIRNYRHAIDNLSYEFVRWWLEKWLTLEKNALIESKEELLIDKVPIKIEKIWVISPDDGVIWDKVALVLIEYEDLSKFDVYGKKDGSYEDIYEIKLVSLEELEKMIINWEIIDVFTISAYWILKANKII